MKGKLNKIDDKWFVEYVDTSYSGGNPKRLGSYTKEVKLKTLELNPHDQGYMNCFLHVDKDTRVDFEKVLINPIGREVDPNNTGQNHSGCTWYAKLINDDKEEQKQHLIDIMKSDEELGLYDDLKDWDVTVGDGLDELELGLYDEPKQETQSEGFHRISKEIDYSEFDFVSFKIGVEWQEQRRYSEEDMKQAFTDGSNTLIYDEINYNSEFKRKMNEWFDQFKKNKL